MMENSVEGTALPPLTPQLGKLTPLTTQPVLIDTLLIVPVEENRIPIIHV